MESHHHVSSSAATASSAAVKLHSQHARDKGIACSLFAETGECSVSKCPYAHITSTTRRPIPQSVCTYYMRYRCLRDDCPFFHLSQERLDELIASGAQDYCPLDGVPRRNPLIPLSAENPPLPAAEVTGARAPDMNRATAETAQRIATASAAQAATPSNHVRRTPNIVQRQASFPHPSTNTIPGHVTVSVGNNYAAATTGNSASPALITPHSSFRTEGGSFAMTSTPMHPMQYVASTQVPSTPLMTHEVVLLPDPRGPHSPLTSHQAQHLGHSHTPATFGYPTPIMSPAASFHQFSTLTNAPSFAVLPAQQVSFEGSQHQHQQQPTPLVYYNSSSLPPPTPITPSSSFYGAPFAGIPYVHVSAHPPANRAPYQ